METVTLTLTGDQIEKMGFALMVAKRAQQRAAEHARAEGLANAAPLYLERVRAIEELRCILDAACHAASSAGAGA